MKPYMPHRGAVAFILRRTAFIDYGAGPGEFVEDGAAACSVGDAFDEGHVAGLVYSIYGEYEGTGTLHITDEATPRASRAYGARIARGRPIRDDIPDGRAGEVIPTPAMIAWARFQAASKQGAAIGMEELLRIQSHALRLMEPTGSISACQINAGGVAFYEHGAPWRFIHKGQTPGPLVSAFADPEGVERGYPGIWRLMEAWTNSPKPGGAQ